MGHIGTYGDPVYISELENDIGLTTDSGTVTGVEIEAGKFVDVQNPTTVPRFKIPTDTSHLENRESEGGAGWQNGTIRTVKTNNRDGITSETTFTPPNSGLADIEVYTHLSQFTNNTGYTNNPGTIEGISFENGVIPAKVYTGRADIKVYSDIKDYTNDSNYATKEYVTNKKIINIESASSIDGFILSDTSIPAPSIYLIRYGKLRLLYFTIVFSASQSKIKTNSIFELGGFGTTGKDMPSIIYFDRYNRTFNIGDGETVYSNNNVNHYYPVSVYIGPLYSLYLSIGGVGSSHNACTTTNFRAVWLVD